MFTLNNPFHKNKFYFIYKLADTVNFEQPDIQ